MLFIDDILLNVAVGVKVTPSSTIRTPKTLESVISILEAEHSNAMVAFEVSEVDFVLISFVLLDGLLFSVLSKLFVNLPFCLILLSYNKLY